MRIAMGRLGVGGRGVGALVDDQVNFILQTFIAGNGPTADPSAVRQSMLQETTATCTESFEPQTDCPNGVPQAAIDAAVATYTADLAAANANRAAYYAANNITPPPPPPPAPIAPLPPLKPAVPVAVVPLPPPPPVPAA